MVATFLANITIIDDSIYEKGLYTPYDTENSLIYIKYK